MRLTKLIGTYLWSGKNHYEPEYGVTVQEVVDKLGKIEDMGCMECPPGNYVEVPFKEGTVIYTIVKYCENGLYGGYYYKITKKKATFADCIRCRQDKSLGKTVFTSEDEAWEALKKIGRKEWYD